MAFSSPLSEKPTWQELISKTNAYFLATQKVTNGKEAEKLVVVTSDTPIHLFLELLSDKKYLSAPIIDPKTKNFLGFVEVLDILGYLLHVHHETLGKFRNVLHKQPFQEVKAFFDAPVSSVINFSHWDDPVFVMESDPIRSVFETMCLSSRHFIPHRVGVISIQGDIGQVITQTDLARFAAHNISLFPKLASTAIKDLNVAKSCLALRVDTPVIDAFELLFKNRVHGLALVDDQYKLIGNLSASDLRGIKSAAFELFTGSILQYFVKGTKSEIHAAIKITEKSTFQEVLSLMVKEKVHRVYIVDDFDRPIQVVTLSDLLPCLILY